MLPTHYPVICGKESLGNPPPAPQDRFPRSPSSAGDLGFFSSPLHQQGWLTAHTPAPKAWESTPPVRHGTQRGPSGAHQQSNGLWSPCGFLLTRLLHAHHIEFVSSTPKRYKARHWRKDCRLSCSCCAWRPFFFLSLCSLFSPSTPLLLLSLASADDRDHSRCVALFEHCNNSRRIFPSFWLLLLLVGPPTATACQETSIHRCISIPLHAKWGLDRRHAAPSTSSTAPTHGSSHQLAGGAALSLGAVPS